jgi:hypothetical protein
MRYSHQLVLVAGALSAAGVFAQNEIQTGKIKRIDAEKGTLTITVNGKDRDVTVDEKTQIRDVAGQPVKERLKHPGFKVGAAVFFKPNEKGVLVGLKLRGENIQPQRDAPPKVDVTKLIPLTDMGTQQYQGYPGGLYPNDKNDRPADHEAAGVALAKKIQPLDNEGKPGPNGKIVLLTVGMSNTNQSTVGFQKAAEAARGLNPKLVIVNGAVGGMTAALIQSYPGGGGRQPYWPTVEERIKAAGTTPAQVQAVWIKEADAGPSEGFPKYAQKLHGELIKVVQLVHSRFPNVKLVYLSSRTYGGYAKTRLNPEPYAYQSGFSVKWLIEQQIKGDPALNFDPAKGEVKAPWLSWGPYLWAQGSVKRSDGFNYDEADFSASDGTHQSQAGMMKVGKQLLQFFTTDSTTKGWFLK